MYLNFCPLFETIGSSRLILMLRRDKGHGRVLWSLATNLSKPRYLERKNKQKNTWKTRQSYS